MDIDGALLTQFRVYKLRAGLQIDATQKVKLYEMALAELDNILQADDSKDILRSFFVPTSQAEIYVSMGKPKLALVTLDAIENHHDVPDFCLYEVDRIRVRALIALGDYEVAIDEIFELQEGFVGNMVSTHIQTDTHAASSRCWYEVGNWEFCIRAGCGAISLERSQPGAHKYLALGYKGEGNLDLAVETMGQALLYEIDEDTGSMEENMRLYQELKAEMESQPTSPRKTVEPDKPYSTTCGICNNGAPPVKGVILTPCHHSFCYSCIKDWWRHYIRETKHKPSERYKGADASCPVCRSHKS
jgi:tetratricopeptide (TPR) repeat protein